MHNKLLSTTVIATWIGLLFGSSIQAQSQGTNHKNAPAVKQSVAELTAPLARSVVEILIGERTVALGTVVSPDGLVVTKASELTDNAAIKCRLWDGREIQPEVLAKDDAIDLALLQLPSTGVSAIDLTNQRLPSAGSFLISVGTDGQSLGLGIATVDERKFSLRHSNTSDRGYLGVNCSPDPKRSGLVVHEVIEESAARRAGIRKGDLIALIDERPLSQVDQLVREIRRHKAGEAIDVVIVRGEQKISIQALLGSQMQFEPTDQWGGGPFSKRRFDFDTVIAHDFPISPEKCGGPVLDTDGHVVGINIARALRVATYAIPVEAVASFVHTHAKPAELPSPASE